MTGYGLCLSILLQPKPEQNLSGAKRKARTPPRVGANELPSVAPKKKLKEEEWSCALCQVSATSERGLNEHLQGKKHKAKEAGLVAQRAGKNPSPFQKKFRKTSKLAVIIDAPGAVNVEKLVGKTHQADIVGDSSLSILKKHNAEDGEKKNEVDDDMNNGDATKPKGQKPVDPKQKKKKFKFWCELCHVGAYCEAVMSTHRKGKKHIARFQEISQCGLPVLVSSSTMTPSEVVVQNAETKEEIAKEVNAMVIATEADEKPVENIEANEDGSGPSCTVNDPGSGLGKGQHNEDVKG